MMAHIKLSLILAGASLLIFFLTRFYAARRSVWKLQKANLPMPEFKLISGHFGTLKETMNGLPSNTTIHAVISQISKRFPTGIFYLNLWPFGRTLLVVTTPSGAAQVQDLNLSKPDILCKPLDTITGGPSLMSMHGATWKRWRSLFNSGFSAGYMIGLASAIADEVEVFCTLLRERVKKSEVFQLEEMTLRLTMDTIGSVVLDTQLHHQVEDNALACALQKQIEWTSFGTTTNPFSNFSIPAIVRWYNNRQMNHYINAEIEKRIVEHLNGFTSGLKQKRSKSIISLVLEQYIKEKQIQGQATSRKAFKQIVAPQLRVFLFAGRDTTSSTLLYCYHMLATHPEILTNLRKEHDEIFGTDFSCAHETISQHPQRLNQLPYTAAVIKEVLRLFPPAASMREGRPGASIVDEHGHIYPTEGCNVWLLTLGLHHNPNYWKEAESFIPERWLVGPEHPLYPVKGAWRAFEFGSRGCIGQTLALLELRIALVMTVREFEIRPAYEEWDEINTKNKKEGGINMVDGTRAYQAKKGGGGAHPADGYPCRVSFRKEWRQ